MRLRLFRPTQMRARPELSRVCRSPCDPDPRLRSKTGPVALFVRSGWMDWKTSEAYHDFAAARSANSMTIRSLANLPSSTVALPPWMMNLPKRRQRAVDAAQLIDDVVAEVHFARMRNGVGFHNVSHGVDCASLMSSECLVTASWVSACRPRPAPGPSVAAAFRP